MGAQSGRPVCRWRKSTAIRTPVQALRRSESLDNGLLRIRSRSGPVRSHNVSIGKWTRRARLECKRPVIQMCGQAAAEVRALPLRMRRLKPAPIGSSGHPFPDNQKRSSAQQSGVREPGCRSKCSAMSSRPCRQACLNRVRMFSSSSSVSRSIPGDLHAGWNPTVSNDGKVKQKVGGEWDPVPPPPAARQIDRQKSSQIVLCGHGRTHRHISARLRLAKMRRSRRYPILILRSSRKA